MNSKTILTWPEWMECAGFLIAGTGKPMTNEVAKAYYDMLKDIPRDALRIACKRSIQEADQTFLPAVGMLRKLASEAQLGTLPLASQEWEQVLHAIRHFGYMRSSEAMETLSPICREVVRSIGWATLCDSENISIQAAQFRMAYEHAAKQESTQRRLSAELRPRITAGPRVVSISQDSVKAITHKIANAFSIPDEVLNARDD